ncbi:tetratricopeptide repeat protein 36-like isoform X1 [Varroa destructor]|uniref:Tetratricopeptide repeat protein n=1 Tax=Varroa destructor TaxID=109461 RepID=A0A7M7KS17_VARDE|nr:tetratricopeptide repeat protein 36-like isoform X1 [Varroa destructor]
MNRVSVEGKKEGHSVILAVVILISLIDVRHLGERITKVIWKIHEEDSAEDAWTPFDEEARAVAVAEAGLYNEAHQLLSDLLNRSTSDNERAALLNDRAQVSRLLGNLTDATEDLDAVLALGVNRRAQRQALTQKALIERVSGRRETAKAFLERAATMGSRFARAQIEAEPTNPYARLCNAMVKKMFEELKAGFSS